MIFFIFCFLMTKTLDNSWLSKFQTLMFTYDL